MLEPCSRRVGQEQWQVADDEVVIVRATGSAGELVILKPQAGIRFPGISRDVHR